MLKILTFRQGDRWVCGKVTQVRVCCRNVTKNLGDSERSECYLGHEIVVVDATVLS